MTDDKARVAAALAAAVFDRTTLMAEQDPLKEIVTIYRTVAKGLNALDPTLVEDVKIADSTTTADHAGPDRDEASELTPAKKGPSFWWKRSKKVL